MRVTRPSPVLVALVLLGGSAAPSNAVTVRGHATWEAHDDASLCFHVNTGESSGGTATALGMVTVPTYPAPVSIRTDEHSARRASLAVPTTLVAEVQALASTVGYRKPICVGGAGGTAIGGQVTFTLDLHSTVDDYLIVVGCRYSAFAPPDCL